MNDYKRKYIHAERLG